MNRCMSCGEDFGSVSAFDAHRVGSHEYLFSESRADGRRCVTTEQLQERGWRRDGRNRWRRPSDGAPWASSGNQAKGERALTKQAKQSHRLRRPSPSTGLPEPHTKKRAVGEG